MEGGNTASKVNRRHARLKPTNVFLPAVFVRLPPPAPLKSVKRGFWGRERGRQSVVGRAHTEELVSCSCRVRRCRTGSGPAIPAGFGRGKIGFNPQQILRPLPALHKNPVGWSNQISLPKMRFQHFGQGLGWGPQALQYRRVSGGDKMVLTHSRSSALYPPYRRTGMQSCGCRRAQLPV